MLDLAPYEGVTECPALVEEIQKLRKVGTRLAEVAQMVASDYEPVHPGGIPCEHLDHKKAMEALDAWKAL